MAHKRRPGDPIAVELTHPRYDRSVPLLRELVSVFVFPVDGSRPFGITLSRVPCLGEHLCEDDRHYRVVYVAHAALDNEGRARFGDHAVVDAELVPEPPCPPRWKPPRNPKRGTGRPRRRD